MCFSFRFLGGCLCVFRCGFWVLLVFAILWMFGCVGEFVGLGGAWWGLCALLVVWDDGLVLPGYLGIVWGWRNILFG